MKSRDLTTMILLLMVNIIEAQSLSDVQLIDWIDIRLGRENLAIENGVLFKNYDKTINDNDRFFIAGFEGNSVFYDNQRYNNVFLNYDMLNDNIIIKPLGKNDRRIIELLTEKVSMFEISNKTFINLGYNNGRLPSFIKGFYEIKLRESRMTLFIKHIKFKKELFLNGLAYDDFTAVDVYIIKFKDTYYQIGSRRDLINIWPTLEKKINQLFDENANLSKNNFVEFMTKIVSNINSFLNASDL